MFFFWKNSNLAFLTKNVFVFFQPTIKEEAETSADSLTIDVEGHDEEDDLSPKLLKTEAAYSVEDRAWIQALRTHVVVPLIRHPKSISFRKPVDPIALGRFLINKFEFVCDLRFNVIYIIFSVKDFLTFFFVPNAISGKLHR